MKKIIKLLSIGLILMSAIFSANLFVGGKTPITVAAASTSVAPPAAINEIFPDARMAARVALKFSGRAVTDQVTQAELDTITYLNVEGMDNIYGIEYLHNVTSMHLTYATGLTDLSPFANANFPKLTDLQFQQTSISDLTPLATANIPNLQQLQFVNGIVSDISPLADMNFPKLTQLFFETNQISDISVLANVNFPSMTTLFLDNNQISDISPLADANFPNLTRLELYNNQISDISPLASADFPKMSYLELSVNQISDISPLADTNFPVLASLKISSNQISDISPLTHTKSVSLAAIDISKNHISDLSPLPSSVLQYFAYGQTITLPAIATSGTINTNNIVTTSAGSLAPISAISNNGSYSEPVLSWAALPSSTTQVSYDFAQSEKTIYGGWSSFSGTVIQPLVSEHTVTFMLDGAVYEDDAVITNNYIGEPTTPVKSGYTFIGWFNQETGGNQWNFSTDTMPDSEMTLYAQFSQDPVVVDDTTTNNIDETTTTNEVTTDNNVDETTTNNEVTSDNNIDAPTATDDETTENNVVAATTSNTDTTTTTTSPEIPATLPVTGASIAEVGILGLVLASVGLILFKKQRK